MRAVVVGARRRHNGLGAHVARYLAEAGVSVCGLVGTTETTVREACLEFARSMDSIPRGYLAISEALDAEAPDVVAVCSPFPLHFEHLRAVSAFGAHCLAEKPLCWLDTPDLRDHVRQLVHGFIDRGYQLVELAQWPRTLPAYYNLYPAVRSTRIERFDMTMCPASAGAQRVLDVGPHLLSMLHTLLGRGRITAIDASATDAGADLRLTFLYHHDGGATEVAFMMAPRTGAPADVRYAINGCAVTREVSLPSYTMFLAAAGRRIPLEDPVRATVIKFLDDVSEERPCDPEMLIDGAVSLGALYRAAAAYRVR